MFQDPGIKKCRELHYDIWASEPDNPESGVLDRLFAEEHGGKNDRRWRRRVRRRYTVAMHVRFGSWGLTTFWKYGMVNQTMVEAITEVINARSCARQEAVAAHSRVAPTHLAPDEVAQDLDKQQREANRQARQARHKARTASSRAMREEAARQPGGMCGWCTWQSHPRRTKCLVCSKLICDRCTYFDAEERKYLLCRSCFSRRGAGPLDPEGRVKRHNQPLRCDKALDSVDDAAHPRGDLVECEDCWRWLCTRCARDDGPPNRCRGQCPELRKRQGNSGPSLLSPFNQPREQKGKGQDKGKGHKRGKKGGVTRQVVEEMQRHADELTQKGALVVAA